MPSLRGRFVADLSKALEAYVDGRNDLEAEQNEAVTHRCVCVLSIYNMQIKLQLIPPHQRRVRTSPGLRSGQPTCPTQAGNGDDAEVRVERSSQTLS